RHEHAERRGHPRADGGARRAPPGACRVAPGGTTRARATAAGAVVCRHRAAFGWHDDRSRRHPDRSPVGQVVVCVVGRSVAARGRRRSGPNASGTTTTASVLFALPASPYVTVRS